MATTGGKGLKRDLIERLPNLKLVASSGVGYDTIDIAACNERGIVVTNTPDVLTDDVADLGLALILATQRGLIKGRPLGARGPLEARRHDAADDGDCRKAPGHRRARQDRQGRCPARAAAGHGRSATSEGHGRPTSRISYFDDLQAMCREVDILLLSCSGGESTRNLVNADVLKALGPKGTLINIARGTVVDEPALIEALQTGGIAGAGLDVFASEPEPSAALIARDNVVLYPHHASGTVETRDAMAQLVVDNLAAFFAGKPLLTPVNLHPRR